MTARTLHRLTQNEINLLFRIKWEHKWYIMNREEDFDPYNINYNYRYSAYDHNWFVSINDL